MSLAEARRRGVVRCFQFSILPIPINRIISTLGRINALPNNQRATQIGIGIALVVGTKGELSRYAYSIQIKPRNRHDKCVIFTHNVNLLFTGKYAQHT